MNGHGGKTRKCTLPQHDSLQYGPAEITESNADVAQLVEHLICNQVAGGSSPSVGTILFIQLHTLIGIGFSGRRQRHGVSYDNLT